MKFIMAINQSIQHLFVDVFFDEIDLSFFISFFSLIPPDKVSTKSTRIPSSSLFSKSDFFNKSLYLIIDDNRLKHGVDFIRGKFDL